jgi:hypothetical protein
VPLFLQTGNQIRVGDVVAAKRDGIDQPFADQIFGFLWV